MNRKPYDPQVSIEAVEATPPHGWFRHLLLGSDKPSLEVAQDIWRRGFTRGQEKTRQTTEPVRHHYAIGGFTGVDTVSLKLTADIPEDTKRLIRDAALNGRLRNAFRKGEQDLVDVKAGEVWYARFSGGLSGSCALYLIRLVEVTDVRVSYQSWGDWKAFQGTQQAVRPGYLEPYEFPKISHYMRHAVTFVERLELPDGD